MGPLTEHWRQLTGSVHPLDEPVFSKEPHTFNLDYPPPAFVGDVENAQVLVLMANGGYDPVSTALEFPDQRSRDIYIDRLHNPRPVDPLFVAPYYAASNFGHLIELGNLAVVNAVAYRSPKISNEPQNRALAAKLTSTRVHRNWLHEYLVPLAVRGERLVIIHRTALWGISSKDLSAPNIIFSRNPASPYLSKDILEKVERHLVTA